MEKKIESDVTFKPKNYFTYRQFNKQQFSVLPTQISYEFCVDFRTKSDYFSLQR